MILLICRVVVMCWCGNCLVCVGIVVCIVCCFEWVVVGWLLVEVCLVV